MSKGQQLALGSSSAEWGYGVDSLGGARLTVHRITARQPLLPPLPLLGVGYTYCSSSVRGAPEAERPWFMTASRP